MAGLSAGQVVLALLAAPALYLVHMVRTHFAKMSQILQRARHYNAMVLAAIDSTSSLPAVSRELSAKVSSASVCELVAMRDRGEVTCEELVLVHIHNLRNYGARFRPVLAERFTAALGEARELDNKIRRKEKVGVLAGIPFSVKDGVSAKGMPTTFGCASLVFNIIEEDANIVRLVKENGAILLAKGSMGMLGATSECENRIAGRCDNPWDPTRTSGGSSGGDSVLVCTRSVAFAIGTDIGGSLRYPAAYCGVYTMKPTGTRLSGQAPIWKSGFPPLFTSWGFLARSFEDLKFLYSLVFCPDMYRRDPLAVPLVWREEKYASTEKLKVGYVTDHSYYPPADACKRAVTETVEVLRNAGHELVEFDIGDLERVMKLSWKVFMSSGEGAARLKQELPLWSFYHIAWRRLTPRFFMALFSHLNLKHKETMMWKALYENSQVHFLKNVSEGEKVSSELMQRMQSMGLDALIVPFPFPAFQHCMTPWLNYSTAWTLLFNFAEMPVGCVPVTVVKEEEQKYEKGADECERAAARVMAGAAGLPVSVQVVARRFQDETCLRLLRELTTALPFSQRPPGLSAVINP